MGEIRPSTVVAICRSCERTITVAEQCFEEPQDRAYHLACAAVARPADLGDALNRCTSAVTDRAGLERRIAGYSLWLDVAADPRDEPRTVLADFLQSEGDPRGEFIALQLAGGERSEQRAEELLRGHGVAWLGELRRIARAARFERGFVTRLELNETAEDIARVVVDRDSLVSFGTVEDLIGNPKRPATYAWLLAGAGLRRLRRIEVWDDTTVAALASVTAPIEHVACDLPMLGAACIESCDRLPALRSLAIRSDRYDALASHAVLGRLAALTITAVPPSLARVRAIWRRLPAATTLEVVGAARLPPCTATAIDRLVLGRRDDGVAVRAAGTWVSPAMVDELAGWPVRIVALEIEGDPTRANRLVVAVRQAAKRLRLAVTVVPPASRLGYVRGGNRA